MSAVIIYLHQVTGSFLRKQQNLNPKVWMLSVKLKSESERFTCKFLSIMKMKIHVEKIDITQNFIERFSTAAEKMSFYFNAFFTMNSPICYLETVS